MWLSGSILEWCIEIGMEEYAVVTHESVGRAEPDVTLVVLRHSADVGRRDAASQVDRIRNVVDCHNADMAQQHYNEAEYYTL